jgi:thiamine-monophosphate kinase
LSGGLSEDDLIAQLFAPLAGPEGLGLLDDAALLAPTPGMEMVLTVDAIVAGVHFFADDPPEAIAAKALGVNLSDLAAKGARPRGFLLSLAMPKAIADAAGWLKAFAAGLGREAATANCPLLGGDTVSTPGPLCLSITALGEVAAGKMVRRTGVRSGDLLYVSGTIGDAALGLKLRLGEAFAISPAHRSFLIDRYLRPRPRNALGAAMAAFAKGGMDVSDGLIGDLTKMLRVSGVTAEVALDDVPFSPAARATIGVAPRMFDLALTGGDDYELLAAVAPRDAAAFEAAANAANVPVTRIGAAKAGLGAPTFLGADGRPRTFANGSFSHF